MSRYRDQIGRGARVVAVLLGLASGGFVVASAASADRSSGKPANPTVEFGRSLSSDPTNNPVVTANSEVSISLHYDADGLVCASVEWIEEATQDEVCSDLDQISTGITYGQHTPRPDAHRLIVGIVPDEVGEVRIDGEHVELSGNVWYVVSDHAPTEFTVRSTDGRLSVTQAIASPDALPPFD